VTGVQTCALPICQGGEARRGSYARFSPGIAPIGGRLRLAALCAALCATPSGEELSAEGLRRALRAALCPVPLCAVPCVHAVPLLPACPCCCPVCASCPLC